MGKILKSTDAGALAEVVAAAEAAVGVVLSPAEWKFLGRVIDQIGSAAAAPVDGQRLWVRCRVIEWACGALPALLAAPSGTLHIRDVETSHPIDLSFARIARPLHFERCSLPEGLLLYHSRVPHLKLTRCSVGPVEANGLDCGGDCVLEDVVARCKLSLRNAHIAGDLRVSRTVVENRGNIALDADGIRIDGCLLLNRGFVALGTVSLEGGRVRGEAKLGRGCFYAGWKGWAIHANRLSVGGNLECTGLYAFGKVGLTGACVKGSIEMEGASLVCSEPYALNLEGAEVGVDVRFDTPDETPGGEVPHPFRAIGSVSMIGARVGGDVQCYGEFLGFELFSLHIGRAQVDGNLYFDGGFAALGQVRLSGLKVGGYVRCRRAEFACSTAGAVVEAAGLEVGADVCFEAGARIAGVLNLSDARVQRGLSIVQVEFAASGGKRAGVNCEGATVGADLEIERLADFGGDLRVESAKIARHLRIADVGCDPLAAVTVHATNVEVGGNLSIQRVRDVGGDVSLPRCRVAGNVQIEGLSFSTRLLGRTTIDLDSACIGGMLSWKDVSPAPGTHVDLTDGTVGRFFPGDLRHWPEKGRLLLNGFSYGALAEDDACDDARGTPAAKARAAAKGTSDWVEWLGRQADRPFRPQPYELLARALRQSGYEDEANALAKEKYRLRRTRGSLSRRANAWRWLLEKSLGHGYDVGPVVLFSFVFVVLGTILFANGPERGLVTPAQELAYVVKDSAWRTSSSLKLHPRIDGYPDFNALVYSIDTFLPVIDLQQEGYWQPVDGECHAGGWTWWPCVSPLRVYLWFHTVAGWMMTTLLVVSLTSLVRRE
ncbi:MAG: rane-associated oxidoreductase [Gemmatimonadetes bacterium]|nr:rane-associated oxidoreductase [Gemmatimonadota bacterium]